MIIIIPLKTAKQYDIRAPLATWVDSSNPYITSSDDLVRLSSLRNCLTAGSICTAYAHSAAIGARGMEDCMEYHACLLEAEKRGFPTVDDAMVGAKELKISWNCAFGEEEPIVRSNIRQIFGLCVVQCGLTAILHGCIGRYFEQRGSVQCD
mmetsp:Transcript_15438/g.36871  ORF Transcript_15438/g.36871 Transcript_15438/m.36871 type:complete len:151 (+) Transcript_15438:59-511(+)